MENEIELSDGQKQRLVDYFGWKDDEEWLKSHEVRLMKDSGTSDGDFPYSVQALTEDPDGGSYWYEYDCIAEYAAKEILGN